MTEFDVLCIGNSAVDVPLNYVDERILSTDSYVIKRIVPVVGGSGTNVSTVLSHLGMKVRFVTLLGDDLLGRFLINHCEEAGIDISGIKRLQTVDTPLSIGLVKRDGERNFIVSESSSTFHFSAEDVDLEMMDGVKLLHFASIFIMPRFDVLGLTKIFREAKSKGVIVCADMMKSRKGERLNAIKSALPFVDYFFANYDEASFLTGKSDENDIATELMQCGVGNVIIKKGRSGCFIKNSEIEVQCPAFVNEDLVDTIGAGDNFVAGFITGLIDGLDIQDCGRFANATASISVGTVGSTEGVRNKEQVLALFNSRQ
ncbi:MAG: carbohydrate kinase family protein [Anaerolineaceae bacterium]|nr:carbohydrate kinase family protein [Anaerolineaceae bacterium]